MNIIEWHIQYLMSCQEDDRKFPGWYSDSDFDMFGSENCCEQSQFKILFRPVNSAANQFLTPIISKLPQYDVNRANGEQINYVLQYILPPRARLTLGLILHHLEPTR